MGTRRLSEIERHLENSPASDPAAIELRGYRLQPSIPTIVPASVRREWMDQTSDRVPTRCLPMMLANQAGTGGSDVPPAAGHSSIDAKYSGNTEELTPTSYARSGSRRVPRSRSASGVNRSTPASRAAPIEPHGRGLISRKAKSPFGRRMKSTLARPLIFKNSNVRSADATT
jgi:hypothetical protein